MNAIYKTKLAPGSVAKDNWLIDKFIESQIDT